MEGLIVPDYAKSFRETLSDLDHFTFIDTDKYTTSGSSVAIESGAQGGVLKLDTAATLNTEALIHPTVKCYKFASSVRTYFEIAYKHTDAVPSTDLASLAIGLTSNDPATLIADGGASVAASMSAAMFTKFSGQAYWNTLTSVGSSQTSYALTASNKNNEEGVIIEAETSAWKTLAIEILPVYGAHMVTFLVDGRVVTRHTAIDITSAAAMYPCMVVKAGAAAAQTLRADYWRIHSSVA